MASWQSKIRKRYQADIQKRGSLQCALCGELITNPDDVTVDHIIPKSMGGRESVFNFQPAHRKCNTDRGNKHTPVSEFLTSL